MEIVIGVLFFLISLTGIWFGSGIIIRSIDKFSSETKSSSFMISFFVLGILTTVPEMAIAYNSFIKGDITVSIGNLMGATLVIFLLVIPLLGVFGGGIDLKHSLKSYDLVMILVLIILPSMFIFDSRLEIYEGVIIIISYVIVLMRFYIDEKPANSTITMDSPGKKILVLVVKIIFSIVIVLVSSNYLVENTIAIARDVGVSPFVISVLGLSIGTNLPEISLAIRAVISGKKDIAIGNYLGSAVANIPLFGFLVLISNGVKIGQSTVIFVSFFTISAVVLFFLITRNRYISKIESLFLLFIYMLFVSSEVLISTFIKL